MPAGYLRRISSRGVGTATMRLMTNADSFDVEAWFEQGERESQAHETPEPRAWISARLAAYVATTAVLVGLLIVAL